MIVVRISVCYYFVGLFVLLRECPLSAEAWVCPSLSVSSRRRSETTALFYSSEFEDGSNQQNRTQTQTQTHTAPILERLRINGVSVSPKGFHVLLESTTARNPVGVGVATATATATEEEAQAEAEPAAAHAHDDDKDETKTPTSSLNSKDNEDGTNAGTVVGDASVSSSDNDNDQDNDKIETTGTSTGTSTSTVVLPLKMTNDPADAYAATSPESLTLCQLLSGVDMAGAILPPELLGKMVVCHIEDKLETLYDDDEEEEDDEEDNKNESSTFTPVLSPIEQKLWEFLQNQEALKREHQALAAMQSMSPVPPFRTQMPQITLDQLTLVPAATSTSTSTSTSISWLCRLECALPDWNERITVNVKPDVLASLAYNYDPESSPLFTCIALALRYKAPIVLEQQQQQPQQQQQEQQMTEQRRDSLVGTSTNNNNNNNESKFWSSRDDLDRDFPQRTTLQSLQQQSNRVMANIERGFEIHKLTGALQIAMRLGDTKAAEKIRAKLDEYDSMDDLPTLGENNHKSNNNNNNNGDSEPNDNRGGCDDRLDDLEKNILQ
eukprot:jgi/Psemu1/2458/gm1.2458_g